jgi:uncharacterized protein YbjT (DUF2867 family)
MKILVTDPSGSIGRKVIAELLAPEFSVRVLARHAARLSGNIQAQVEVVQGPIDDFATLRKAMDGVEAVFWRVPLPSRYELNVRAYYERAAVAGCRAIHNAGTPRVVTISAGGNMFARKAGPISALHAMEDILNQSGAAIRHLSCGWFMENFLHQAQGICRNGVFSYPMAGDIALPMVAARDIAEIALRRLVRRDWAGVRSISVSGPQDLSFNRAATVISEVLNRPVQYREVSPEQSIRSLVRSGASVHYARSVAAMFAALAQGILLTAVRPAVPTPLTTLGAWAKIELLPVLAASNPQADSAANPAVLAEAEGEEQSLFSSGL